MRRTDNVTLTFKLGRHLQLMQVYMLHPHTNFFFGRYQHICVSALVGL